LKTYQCPWCRGAGGFIDRITEDGGPLEPCGFCNGKGELRSKKLYFIALSYLGHDGKRIKKEFING
jgi:DnaJ-class molecular chaperone